MELHLKNVVKSITQKDLISGEGGGRLVFGEGRPLILRGEFPE